MNKVNCCFSIFVAACIGYISATTMYQQERKVAKKAAAIIKKCEKKLPRNVSCRLTAEPREDFL